MRRTLSAGTWRNMRDEADTQARQAMPRTHAADPKPEWWEVSPGIPRTHRNGADCHAGCGCSNSPEYKTVYSV